MYYYYHYFFPLNDSLKWISAGKSVPRHNVKDQEKKKTNEEKYNKVDSIKKNKIKKKRKRENDFK